MIPTPIVLTHTSWSTSFQAQNLFSHTAVSALNFKILAVEVGSESMQYKSMQERWGEGAT